LSDSGRGFIPEPPLNHAPARELDSTGGNPAKQNLILPVRKAEFSAPHLSGQQFNCCKCVLQISIARDDEVHRQVQEPRLAVRAEDAVLAEPAARVLEGARRRGRGGGVRVERDIYILNVDSGSVTRLADKGGYDIAGAWSPDNKQIAFVSDREGGYYRLYMMNSDGSNQRHVALSTDSERDVTNIAWSPDGRYIVYGTSEHINTQQVLTPTLFIADLATQEVVRLTSEELGACDEPDWSPDGKWIAMVCSKGELTDASGEVYIIRPDGTDFKQITVRPADYKPSFPRNSFRTWIGNPRWSPDGNQIAYIAAVNGSWNIYVTDFDGKNSRRLTGHNAVDWSISTYRLP